MFDIQNSIIPLIRHYTSYISHKAKQEPEECVNSNIPRSISQKPQQARFKMLNTPQPARSISLKAKQGLCKSIVFAKQVHFNRRLVL